MARTFGVCRPASTHYKQTSKKKNPISLRSRPDYVYFCRLVIIPLHSLPAPLYAQYSEDRFSAWTGCSISYIYISGIKVCLCVCALWNILPFLFFFHVYNTYCMHSVNSDPDTKAHILIHHQSDWCGSQCNHSADWKDDEISFQMGRLTSICYKHLWEKYKLQAWVNPKYHLFIFGWASRKYVRYQRESFTVWN